MKLSKIVYLTLITLPILAGCEETVELDIDQTAPVYIVEGLITNEYKQHYVRLTRSTGFYDNSPAPAVSGAVITVNDTINFIEDGENQGYYLSEHEFAGAQGVTYSLKIEVNNEIFTASDKLNPVTSIDSITWEPDLEYKEDNPDEEYYIDILIYTKEPQETEDFYLFKFYRNDSVKNNDFTEIYYADDRFIAEQINGLKGAVFYKPGDKATFEMLSLTREAFVYYDELQQILNNDGGMFSGIPGNAKSNIKGGAFGLFQASSIVRETVYITE